MRLALSWLLLVVLLGCESSSTGAPQVAPLPLLETLEPEAASVAGYVFDPEAFFIWNASCQGECPPPLHVSGLPALESSLVKGASVWLVDPRGSPPRSSAVTDRQGTWELLGVGLRRAPPWFAQATPTADASLQHVGPPFTATAPAKYLPTETQRPISTFHGTCAGLPVALISEAGAVDAVARHLSKTPAELLEAGLLIVWLYAPESPLMRAPAAGAQLESSHGSVFALDWAPPGSTGSAAQSPRGFFVLQEEQTSPLGLFAVLLPNASREPAPDVQLRPSGVSWSFPPLPPQKLTPGVISFLELPALVPNAPRPPKWACLP